RRQTVDEANERLAAAMRRRVSEARAERGRLSMRLYARHPSVVVAGARASLGPLEVKLAAAIRRRLDALRGPLGGEAARLDSLSPLAVLGRGYAVARGPSGRTVVDAGELHPGDVVRVRVHRGEFSATVLEVTAPDANPLISSPSPSPSPCPKSAG